MEWERITNALQCERGIAGCLLMAPEETLSMIRQTILAGDFLDPKAKEIFKATVCLIDRKKPCDANLIQVEAGVETEYCRDVMMETPSIGNAGQYAQIVHEAAQQRKAQEIGNDLSDGKLDAVSALAKLQELLRSQSGGIVTPQESAQRAMDVFSAAADGSLTPFLKTGYHSLDSILSGGLVNGGLITIAARPATGKSTVAINIAENVCAAGRTVLYFSLEMPNAQIWACRAANTARLNRSDILSGKILRRGSAEDRTREETRDANILSKAFDSLYCRPFYIYDEAVTIEDIERKARCIPDLALIVIDHIGLIKNNARSSRYEFMTAVSHQLKQLAMSLKIPVLALCQLNRASENRNRPTMADLRDSGAVEEDSDVVCLLYRQRLQGASWEPIELIIDKNRHGGTGILELGFYGVFAKIAEG